MKEPALFILGKHHLVRGNGTCKGPEAGTQLAYLRTVTGFCSKAEVEGDEVREALRSGSSDHMGLVSYWGGTGLLMAVT